MTLLAHLHVKDPFGNLETLICRVTPAGMIAYTYYGGTASSGIPMALSNLGFHNGASLPMQKTNPKETTKQFRERLINIINTGSCFRVAKVLEPVEFEKPSLLKSVSDKELIAEVMRRKLVVPECDARGGA